MKFRIGILFTLFNLATINGFSQSLNKVYKFSNSTIRSHFDFVFETNQGYDVFGETLYISGPISGPGIANQDILYMKLDSCGNVMNTFRIGGMEGDFLLGVFIYLLGNYDLICERKTPSTQQKDYDSLIIRNKHLTNLIKQWHDNSSLDSFVVYEPGEFWLEEQNRCGITRDTIIIRQEIPPQVYL